MRRWLWALFAFSGILPWIGCGGGAGGSSSSSSTTTQLRFVQASPGAPNVNLLIDSKSVATNLAYGNDTGYLAVKAGSRHIQVQAVNSTSNILDQSVPVTSGSSETLFMTGPANSIKALTLTDGGTTAVSNDGYVRVINASGNIGTVDVYVVAAGTSLAGLTPTAASVPFDGDTGYQLMAAGSVQVFLTKPGTTNVVLSIGPISVKASDNQTLVALDGPSGGVTYAQLIDQ